MKCNSLAFGVPPSPRVKTKSNSLSFKTFPALKRLQNQFLPSLARARFSLSLRLLSPPPPSKAVKLTNQWRAARPTQTQIFNGIRRRDQFFSYPNRSGRVARVSNFATTLTHHGCDVKEYGTGAQSILRRNLLPQSEQNLELNRGSGRRASYIQPPQGR